MHCITKCKQAVRIGIIWAYGSSRGAAVPFTTVDLAQAVGTFTLHHIAMGLFDIMLVY
jgi:hypothetical protein